MLYVRINLVKMKGFIFERMMSVSGRAVRCSRTGACRPHAGHERPWGGVASGARGGEAPACAYLGGEEGVRRGFTTNKLKGDKLATFPFLSSCYFFGWCCYWYSRAKARCQRSPEEMYHFRRVVAASMNLVVLQRISPCAQNWFYFILFS